MTAVVDLLFEQMAKSKGYPALETTVATLLSYLNDNTKGAKDLVTLVVSDFTMTQKILKLVNSPMYAPFGGNVHSITDALRIVGTTALSHIVLSIAMVSSLGISEKALAKTLLSSEVARAISDNNEHAAVASLIYDLGNLLTSKYLPDKYATMKKFIKAGADPDMAAKKVFGLTLSDIGVAVAERWKYPVSLTTIIDGTGDTELIKIAKFSNTSAELLQDSKHEELAAHVDNAELPDYLKEKVVGILDTQKDVFAKLVDDIEPVVVSVASRKSKEPELIELVNELVTGYITLDLRARFVLSRLFDILEADHCLLFILTQAGNYVPRYGHGKGIDELRDKFRFSKDYKATAFHAAIKNKVDLVIADVSKLPAKALPDGYAKFLPQTTQFIVMPIQTVVGEVIGLLYIDWHTSLTLEADELKVIRLIRDGFSRYLS